jgi:uncharacterized protein YhhL (DUF1145 family)
MKNNKTFWCDDDGFTSRDFKISITGGTWFMTTVWLAVLLVLRSITSEHLEFYRIVSNVFMVLLGGMAGTQVIHSLQNRPTHTTQHYYDVPAGMVPSNVSYQPMSPDGLGDSDG